jgi:hypothetical protein
MLGEPANVRRQARTSVQRGAQNLAAAMKCCQKKRRVTTATPVGLGFGATEVDEAVRSDDRSLQYYAAYRGSVCTAVATLGLAIARLVAKS